MNRTGVFLIGLFTVMGVSIQATAADCCDPVKVCEPVDDCDAPKCRLFDRLKTRRAVRKCCKPECCEPVEVCEPADSGPQAAVRKFLDAVRNGDDQTLEQMLTTAARTTTRSLGLDVASVGSDTAEFEIGEVEYITEDGARVACTLSDLDENNQRQTAKIVWMLRHESEGWRIAGLVTILKGEPVGVDFESLEGMRKLKTGQGGTQAQLPDAAPGTIQR